jgi:hypothetical protein
VGPTYLQKNKKKRKGESYLAPTGEAHLSTGLAQPSPSSVVFYPSPRSCSVADGSAPTPRRRRERRLGLPCLSPSATPRPEHAPLFSPSLWTSSPSPPRGSRAGPSTAGGRRRASAWTTTTRRRTNVSIRTAVVFSVDLSRQFELTGPRADASFNFLPPATVDFDLEIRRRPSFSASPGFSFTLPVSSLFVSP